MGTETSKTVLHHGTRQKNTKILTYINLQAIVLIYLLYCFKKISQKKTDVLTVFEDWKET